MVRLMTSYLAQPHEFHLERNSATLVNAITQATYYYSTGTLGASLRVLADLLMLIAIFALLAVTDFLTKWWWLLALGVMLWSAATLSTGLVRNFTLLLTARLLLGIGESASYPAVNKIIVTHFHASQRGRANGRCHCPGCDTCAPLLSPWEVTEPFGHYLGGERGCQY